MSELVSVRTAAQKVGVSTTTIRKYVKSGKIPGYRVGDRVFRVSLNDVTKMLLAPVGGDQTSAVADAKVGEHIEKLLTEAPPLCDEQRARIAALITAGGGA